MALTAKVGSFSAPVATNATFAVTGVGFQPKWIFLWGNRLTADGSAADGALALGAGTSSTDRVTVAGDTQHNVATEAAFATQDNTRVYKIMGNSATALVQADLVSLDSDGFTLNFSVVDASNAYVVNYLALGGSALTNAHQGADTNKITSTGTKAVTGMGFQPNLLFLLAAASTFTANPTTAAASFKFALGWASSSTTREHSAGSSLNGVTSNALDTPAQRQVATSLYSTVTSTTVVGAEADLSSLDADGFTLNWTTIPASARFYYYAGLEGAFQSKIGRLTQSTGGTGTQAVTGVGFQPTAIILLSDQQAASTSNLSGNEKSLGMATGSSQRAVAWFGDKALASTTNTTSSQNLDRTKVIKFLTEAGASPTLLAAADLSSLDTDGFTLNWTTNDNVGRDILYLALGSEPFAAQSPTAPAQATTASAVSALVASQDTSPTAPAQATTASTASIASGLTDLTAAAPAQATTASAVSAAVVSQDTSPTAPARAQTASAASVVADLPATAPAQAKTAAAVSATLPYQDTSPTAPAQAATTSAVSATLTYQDTSPAAPAQATTASSVTLKTSGASATGTGTGLATLSADTTHSVTWTTLTGGFSNTTGTETVIEALNSAGDGFRLGSLPAYGGMPFAALYELLGSGGSPTVVNASQNAEDPGNQVSLKTTNPDGHLHVFFAKTGTGAFVGTEDIQSWTRSEVAPTATAVRRYVRATGTDSNGVAWTVDACVWPSGHIFYTVSFTLTGTTSLTVTGQDSFEVCAPAGLLPATGSGTQQGPWVAPGLSGYSSDTTRSFSGLVSTLSTTGGIPDGASSNTSGEPDFLAFLPSTVGNGGQVGTLADQGRGALVAKFTHFKDIFNVSGGVQVYPGGGYSSLSNTNRVKAKWAASPTSLPAGTYTLYLMEVYSPLVTPAGAGTLTQAKANMLAVVADYLQPGTPAVSLGTPSAFTYAGRSTGCFRLDQGCYEVQATAAGAAAIQLDLSAAVQPNIRYSPRYRFTGLPGSPAADGSDFRLLWGSTPLVANTDYTIAVDTAAGVAYVHLQRDVVASGASGTQLQSAILTFSPLVVLTPAPAQATTASAVSALTVYRDTAPAAPARAATSSTTSAVTPYQDTAPTAPARALTNSTVSGTATFQDLTAAAPAHSVTASALSVLVVYADIGAPAPAQARTASQASSLTIGQDLTPTAPAQAVTASGAATLPPTDLSPAAPARAVTVSTATVLLVTSLTPTAPARGATACAVSALVPFQDAGPTTPAQAATASAITASVVHQDLTPTAPAHAVTASAIAGVVSYVTLAPTAPAQATTTSTASAVLASQDTAPTAPARATTASQASAFLVYQDLLLPVPARSRTASAASVVPSSRNRVGHITPADRATALMTSSTRAVAVITAGETTLS